MARTVRSATWAKKNRGVEYDTHELLRRIAKEVNEGEPLQVNASHAVAALEAVDRELEGLGLNAAG